MKKIDEKISAFVKRYVKMTPPEEIEAAYERNLRRLRATLEAREQAPKANAQEPARRYELEPLEYLVLTSVHLLRGEGYGISIRDKVSEMSGKQPPLPSIYIALDHLEDRGFVKTRLTEPLPERGGRPKRLYGISSSGEQALSYAREHLQSEPGFLRDSV